MASRGGAPEIPAPSKPRRACAVAGVLLLVLGACNAISGADEMLITGGDAGRATTDAANDGATPTPPPGPRGDGGPQVSTSGVVTVLAPSGLDFGDLSCGTAPPSRDIEIRNETKAEITFTATLATGTKFWLSHSDGIVTAKNSAFISVSSAGVPSGGPVGVFTDVLSITTNAPGDTPHPLDVTLSASGAILNVSPSGSLDWGTMSGTAVSKKLTIRNDGNITGTIDPNLTLNTLNTFSISPSTPLVIAGGEVGILTVTANPPKSGATQKNGRLTFSSTSTLCGPMPTQINLIARRPD